MDVWPYGWVPLLTLPVLMEDMKGRVNPSRHFLSHIQTGPKNSHYQRAPSRGEPTMEVSE
jgi:hypothetical protein